MTLVPPFLVMWANSGSSAFAMFAELPVFVLGRKLAGMLNITASNLAMGVIGCMIAFVLTESGVMNKLIPRS